jgi:UDP-glucose 4-epimerase
MHILVTGGAGYVGSHTCVTLLEAGHQVVVVDNFSNSSLDGLHQAMKLAGKSLRIVEADIRDRAAMAEVLTAGSFDAILHFAALKSAPESIERPEAYWDVNVGGTAVVLEAALAAGVGKFVFSSSAIVYGAQDKVPTPESAELRPLNPYAWTKLAGEQMLRDVARSRPGFHACCLRYFNPIGNHPSGLLGESPRQRPTNLFPIVLSAYRQGAPVDIFGTDYETADGSAVRDFIHVMDVAEGHAAALRLLNESQKPREGRVDVFNLGTGRGSSVLDLVKAMERVTGRSIARRESGRRTGDIAVSLADPARSAKMLGWRATRSLEDACTDALKWLETLESGTP